MEVYRNFFDGQLVTITNHSDYFVLTYTQTENDPSLFLHLTLKQPDAWNSDTDDESEEFFHIQIIDQDDGFKTMSTSEDGTTTLTGTYKFRRDNDGKYHQWYSIDMPRERHLRFVTLSDELCDFLGLEYGSKSNRKLVNIELAKYVKQHKLQDPDCYAIINPDEKLSKLLDYDPFNSDTQLSYITIQARMRRHYK